MNRRWENKFKIVTFQSHQEQLMQLPYYFLYAAMREKYLLMVIFFNVKINISPLQNSPESKPNCIMKHAVSF